MLFQAVVLAVYQSLWTGAAHPTGHHKLVMQLDSWEDAQRYCRSHFVDLAVASSPEELDAVLKTVENYTESIWIGLRHGVPAGWAWVDGRTLSYSPWGDATPQGGCGSVRSHSASGRNMLARMCLVKLPFICQGPLPPDRIDIIFVGTDCVSFKWDRPVAMKSARYSFKVSYLSASQVVRVLHMSNSSSILICGLTPGSKYTFSVSTVMETAGQSDPASITVITRLDPPVKVLVDSILSGSVSLSWTEADTRSNRSCFYNISYASLDGMHTGFILSAGHSSRIDRLQSHRDYIINVTAVNLAGASSVPATVFLCIADHNKTVFYAALCTLQFLNMIPMFWFLHHYLKVRINKKDDEEIYSAVETIVDM